jgi:CheY-like chemotaxis protein
VFKPHEIAGIVTEAGKLLRSSIPKNIDIKIETHDDCGSVVCDATQIHQVLMNLCINAWHAIGKGQGTIGISCRSYNTTQELPAAVPELVPGAYVVVEVSDTGIGMDTDTMARIFDAYFTTKEQGTGLGLPIVKAIVTAHHGKIQVESAPEKGSTFRVFLPTQETSAPAMAPIGPAHWELGAEESVLLVEDDETNGPMLSCALRELRYKVTLAINGNEALALLMKNPATYQFMITDIFMPAMGGMELVKKAHELSPSLPVILMSGILGAISRRELDSMGIGAFLKKPFGIGDLSRALKAVITKSNVEN